MGKMIAKLVCISLMARVIVDEDATEEEILQASKPKFQDALDSNEHTENVEFIKDDSEVPFSLSDAVAMTIKELSVNFKNLPPDLNVKNLVFCSAKDLLPDTTEEEFDIEWENQK